MTADSVVLVAAERGGDSIVASAAKDGQFSSRVVLPTWGENKRVAEIGVHASTDGVAVAAEGAGAGWRLLRAGAVSQLAASSWTPSEGSLCAVGSTLFGLRRVDSGFVVGSSSLAGGEWKRLAEPVDALGLMLQCGARGPFLLGDDGEHHFARTFRDEKPANIVVVGDNDFSDDERGLYSKVQGDELVVVRAGEKSGVQIRLWDGSSDKPSAWEKTALSLPEDSTIEHVMVTATHVVFVTSRDAGATHTCADGEQPDTIAEVSVVSRADGKVTRQAERIESWRCGADVGPFFGGMVQNKIAIAWPRGADVACSKKGVRFGGIGFATFAPGGEGNRKVSSINSPAEWLEFAGCSTERCSVVAIDRTKSSDNTCVDGADPEAGEPKVLSFP